MHELGLDAAGGERAHDDRSDGDMVSLRPTAMTTEQAARVLSAVGARHATAENIRRDIEAGAPTNPDGTLNLVHYTAWLAREVARGS